MEPWNTFQKYYHAHTRTNSSISILIHTKSLHDETQQPQRNPNSCILIQKKIN